MMELMKTIHSGSYGEIKILVTLCTDIHYKNSGGVTYLEAAVSRGNPDIVKLLFDHGANICGAPSSKTWADLFFDVVYHRKSEPQNQLNLLELLLQHGLHLSGAEDYPSIQPRVLYTITLEVFVKLLAEGMIVNDFTQTNSPFPLIPAYNNSDDRVWRYILSHKLVDLCEIDMDGRTILMVMANGPSEFIKNLVEAGADANEYDENLDSPLTLSMSVPELTQNFQYLFSVSNSSSIILAFSKSLSLNYTAYTEFIVKSIAKSNYHRPQPIISQLNVFFGSQFNILFQECTNELENLMSRIVFNEITWRDIFFSEDLKVYLSNYNFCRKIPCIKSKFHLVHYSRELDEKLDKIYSKFQLKIVSEIQIRRLLNLKKNESFPQIVEKVAGFLNEDDLKTLGKFDARR